MKCNPLNSCVTQSADKRGGRFWQSILKYNEREVIYIYYVPIAWDNADDDSKNKRQHAHAAQQDDQKKSRKKNQQLG